jgi:O-antigen/teichoic acid export membrane protein
MKQQILNLGKDSLIYGVGSVITRFIGLITLPLFTAYLTPEEFGVLAMLALLTMVAQPVFSLGLSAAMGPSYFANDCSLNKSKAVWTVFAINVVSASILGAVAWLFPEILGHLVSLSVDYSPLISLSLTGCALTILATSFTQRVQFEKQAKLYVAATLVTAVVAILVSIITVVMLGWGVRGMVIGQLAGNAATFAAFFLIGVKAIKPSISLTMAKELLRLGFPLIPGFAFLFVLMHGNKYILEQTAGLAELGIYSVGFNLGTAISIATGGISSAWYPFFMTYVTRKPEATVIFGRIFTYFVFSIGALCILFFLAAKPLLIFVTEASFHSAHIVVGFVALANMFLTAFNMFLPGVYFNNDVKYVSFVQACALLFAVPLNYYLIANLGVLGAAIGVAIGFFLLAAFMCGWNKINGKLYIHILYEWRRIFSFVFIAVVIVGLYFQLPATTLLGHVVNSILMWLLMLSALVLLLNKRERQLLFRRNDTGENRYD